MTPEEKPFLGRGWSFPPAFSPASGTVAMVSGAEDINQSLSILLSTSLGERLMQPGYGCNLSDFQFEPLNTSLTTYLKDMVETAILYHEPRIELDLVEITESTSREATDGLLRISVTYTVRGTNSRLNYVFPFYLKEAIFPPDGLGTQNRATLAASAPKA
jgi:phage baseplate assembly protein W